MCFSSKEIKQHKVPSGNVVSIQLISMIIFYDRILIVFGCKAHGVWKKCRERFENNSSATINCGEAKCTIKQRVHAKLLWISCISCSCIRRVYSLHQVHVGWLISYLLFVQVVLLCNARILFLVFFSLCLSHFFKFTSFFTIIKLQYIHNIASAHKWNYKVEWHGMVMLCLCVCALVCVCMP